MQVKKLQKPWGKKKRKKRKKEKKRTSSSAICKKIIYQNVLHLLSFGKSQYQSFNIWYY